MFEFFVLTSIFGLILFTSLCESCGSEANLSGVQSTRGDVMLFLLMQFTIAAKHHGLNVGLSNPWTEYVRILPIEVPVPTLWNEEERALLVGTSLEVGDGPPSGS